MISKAIQRPIAAAVASIFLLSACVTTNPDGTTKLDDKAYGALIGAAGGCALGAAINGSKGCIAGAVAGAAVGLLIAWHFESKKLADANSVNREYEKQVKASKGKMDPLPKNEIIPAKFGSKIQTTAPDQSGQKEVQITSNTDLVGYGDKVPDVQQKYAIYDDKNNLVEERTEKLAAVDGGGRYQTSSKFKLPADAKSKNYTVKTTLVSDNKTYRENSYKVTLLADQIMLVATLY
jgi:hypothetical protein